MTGALAVKGFNEISYDELMDVNGGAEPYARIVLDDGIGVAIGIRFDNGGTLELGATTGSGVYLRYSNSY